MEYEVEGYFLFTFIVNYYELAQYERASQSIKRGGDVLHAFELWLWIGFFYVLK